MTFMPVPKGGSSSLLKFSLSILAIAASQYTHAAAFQFYELGSPVNGTAAVGQAALASDASTAYFNPAGMARLPGTEVMLGSQIILPYTNFSPNNSTTFTGNNGGSAGVLAPVIGGFFVYNYSPKLKFGVSLTAPYGGAFSYNDHWVGRYDVQQMTLYTLNLNPAIAYQVNQWLAIGGGFSIEYANLNQIMALPVDPSFDGQANLKLDNTSGGFNLGVLFTPQESTRIGIAYRSQIIHHLGGNVDFLNISTTPTASTRMVMPANIIASLAQNIKNVTLLGELGWSNWSTMRNSIVSVANFTGSVPQNWHDTYRVGIGGQYHFTMPLLIQAGISYDSSPTSASRRLPQLPVDGQVRVGAGAEYGMTKSTTLGVSYEYMSLGNASIDNINRLGTLSGSYSRNFANVFQASLNVTC